MARNPCLFNARHSLYAPSALTSTNSAFCQHNVFMHKIKVFLVYALSHMRKWFITVVTIVLNGSVGPLYLGGRSPRYSLNKRLGRPPELVWTLWKIGPLRMPSIDQRFLRRPARSLLTIPTTLHRFTCIYVFRLVLTKAVIIFVDSIHRFFSLLQRTGALPRGRNKIFKYHFDELLHFELFIYLAGCTTFSHLPAPIEHLQYLLSPFVSVIPVFFH